MTLRQSLQNEVYYPPVNTDGPGLLRWARQAGPFLFWAIIICAVMCTNSYGSTLQRIKIFIEEPQLQSELGTSIAFRLDNVAIPHLPNGIARDKSSGILSYIIGGEIITRADLDSLLRPDNLLNRPTLIPGKKRERFLDLGFRFWTNSIYQQMAGWRIPAICQPDGYLNNLPFIYPVSGKNGHEVSILFLFNIMPVNSLEVHKSALYRFRQVIGVGGDPGLFSNQRCLSSHYFGLSRVHAKLKQSHDNQSDTDEDTGDNGKPIQEGLTAGTICVVMLGAAGVLFLLGERYSSVKREVCFQALGLVMVLATPIVAILGGYRIVHGDYGLFSVGSPAPPSSPLLMLSHGHGISA